MKLTVQVKLLADATDSIAIINTMRAANEACNWLSTQAWDTKVFSRYRLQAITYHECRRLFPSLSSQCIIRCIAKVADAYKAGRLKESRKFKPLGSIAYDSRILSWKTREASVSIWTTSGRKTISFTCGSKQATMLANHRCESDLVYRDKKHFLFVSVDIPDTTESEAKDWLGVDLGVVEIATTSDKRRFTGKHLNKLRSRNNKLRARLNSIGSRSSRRLLRKRRRKERRFSSNVNHAIAKQLVSVAKRTGRGIALENLKGIRARIRATMDTRRALHSWAFADLGDKIVYKAKMAGVPVRFVDPRNTSRTCPVCGHCAKANRKSRDKFMCRQCGHEAHADENGAENIRRKALVLGAAVANQPDAPNDDVVPITHTDSASAEFDVARR